MPIPFSKYVGCGNDFIVIDNRLLKFPIQNRNFIMHLCHRRQGIGADGIVLLEPSLSSDFKMRIFNADGSEAEMCGNGIRCLLKFIKELGFQGSQYRIETMERKLLIKWTGDNICIEMGKPTDQRWNLSLCVTSNEYTVHYLNTGVPHAVLFVDDFESINIQQIGSLVRFHPLFTPKGTNVNFAKLGKNKEIWVRTYERGVEGETLACGTGATAVGIAAYQIFQILPPMRIHTKSEEILLINFDVKEHVVYDVTMTGPATLIYQGTIMDDSM